MLRQPREQRRTVARQPGMHHELVLVDQPQLRQRQRERHAPHEQPLSRLPLELLNGRLQIPAYKLRKDDLGILFRTSGLRVAISASAKVENLAQQAPEAEQPRPGLALVHAREVSAGSLPRADPHAG